MATGLTKKQKEALTDKIAGLIRNGPALRMTLDSSVNEMNINQISAELNRIHYRAIGKEYPAVISFKPKQLGFGVPSPDNVRPIVEYEIDGIGNVGGGSLDLDTGVYTETHALAVFGSADGWEHVSAFVYGFRYRLTSELRGVGVYNSPGELSNILTPAVSHNPTGTSAEPNTFLAGVYMNMNITGVGTVEQLDEFLIESPLQILYTLQTPIHYELTPQQMLQLLDQL